MESIAYAFTPSPLGDLLIAATGKGLCLCQRHEGGAIEDHFPRAHWGRVAVHVDPNALKPYARQLKEYFAGKRTEFDIPVDPRGTDFQRKAWQFLRKIPYAQTRSYAQEAKGIGSPKASRAAGQANRRNPVGIVIPCHRVIAADCSLGGYAGGLEMKQWLLDHERKVAARAARQ